MDFLLQENEFLKSIFEAHTREVVMAREAFNKELNFYTLAHTTSMADKHTENDPYKEYMCNQCGNIYQQAGYKIVQVPMPGASTSSKVK